MLHYPSKREIRKQERLRKKREHKRNIPMAKKQSEWDFNIRPGMSIWRDMPQEYKDAYYKHIAVVENNKEIAIKQADAIRRATDRQQREIEKSQEEAKAKKIEARFTEIRARERERWFRKSKKSRCPS